jgi:hypothetical protein
MEGYTVIPDDAALKNTIGQKNVYVNTEGNPEQVKDDELDKLTFEADKYYTKNQPGAENAAAGSAENAGAGSVPSTPNLEAQTKKVTEQLHNMSPKTVETLLTAMNSDVANSSGGRRTRRRNKKSGKKSGKKSRRQSKEGGKKHRNTGSKKSKKSRRYSSRK